MAGTWCSHFLTALWVSFSSQTKVRAMKQHQEPLAFFLRLPLAFVFSILSHSFSSTVSSISSFLSSHSHSSLLQTGLRRGLPPVLTLLGFFLLLFRVFLFANFTRISTSNSRGAHVSSKGDAGFSSEKECLGAATSQAPVDYSGIPTEPLHLSSIVTSLQQARVSPQSLQDGDGVFFLLNEETTERTNMHTELAGELVDPVTQAAAAAVKEEKQQRIRKTHRKELAVAVATAPGISVAAAQEEEGALEDSSREAAAAVEEIERENRAASTKAAGTGATAPEGRDEDDAGPAAPLHSFLQGEINGGQQPQNQLQRAEVRLEKARQPERAATQRGRRQKKLKEDEQQHQNVEPQRHPEERQHQKVKQQQEDATQQQQQEYGGGSQEQDEPKQPGDKAQQQEKAKEDNGKHQGNGGEKGEEEANVGQQKPRISSMWETETEEAAVWPRRGPTLVGSARSRNLSAGRHLASPFSSVFSPFSPSSLSASPFSSSPSVENSAEESTTFSLFPPARGFIGRQSHNIRLNSCTALDVFLVSPLPSSLKKRFPVFAAREKAEGQGLPLLHHVHVDASSSSSSVSVPKQKSGGAAARKGERERDTVNPRLVVESSAATPLWTFQEARRQEEGVPVVRVAEGAATIFRLSAPVNAFTDLISSLLELPVMGVEIHADYSLALSYRLSATEGRMLQHTHVDSRHRPIADLDIQYLKCRSKEADELEAAAAIEARRKKEKEDTGDTGTAAAEVQLRERDAEAAAEAVEEEAIAAAAAHALLVNVTVWTHSCPAVSFFWRVVCAGNNKHIQEPAAGFHVGTTVRAAMALNVDEEKLFSSSPSAADSPSAASAAWETARVLQLLTRGEGDVIADGAASELCKDVRDPGFVVGPEKSILDLLAWCHGCKNGAVDVHLPSVAADLDVVYPVLHYFSPSTDDEEELQQQVVTPGVVPQQHLTVKNVKEGEQNKRIHRFRLEFRCRSEGTSIVAMEFLLHGARPIQVFLRKTCNAPVAAPLAADPTCATGLANRDGDVCCTARCGTCGGSGCHSLPGGPEECCVRHIQTRGRVCALSQPPCLLKPLEAEAEGLGAVPPAASHWLPLNFFHFSSFSSLLRVHTHSRLCALLALCMHLLTSFLYGIGLLLVLLYFYTAVRLKFSERMRFKHALRPAPQELLHSGFLVVGCMRYFYITKLRKLLCIWRADAHMYDALEEDTGGNSSSSSGLCSFSTCAAAAAEKHPMECSSSSNWGDIERPPFAQHQRMQSIPLAPLTFSKWNDPEDCCCGAAAADEDEEEKRLKHTI